MSAATVIGAALLPITKVIAQSLGGDISLASELVPPETYVLGPIIMGPKN